jgi:hypothetical protein
MIGLGWPKQADGQIAQQKEYQQKDRNIEKRGLSVPRFHLSDIPGKLDKQKILYTISALPRYTIA